VQAARCRKLLIARARQAKRERASTEGPGSKGRLPPLRSRLTPIYKSGREAILHTTVFGTSCGHDWPLLSHKPFFAEPERRLLSP
jgi:hypothetical protein